MQSVDQKIYNMLAQQENKQQEGESQNQVKEYGPTFFVHLIAKIVPLALMLLRNVLGALIGKTLVVQLVLLFVVLDFWLTKNITGKRMIGMRWGFEQNQYGDQKFQFEGRVNEEYVNSGSSKFFWLIQAVYTIVPVVFIALGIISVSIFKMNLDDILLYVAIAIGGGANLFFFWKAARGVSNKRAELNSKLGNQFCSKMGNATIVSYL